MNPTLPRTARASAALPMWAAADPGVHWRLERAPVGAGEDPLRVEAATAILIGLALGACDAPPPAAPPMRPVGAPGFVEVGGAVVPRFDQRRPPVVRVDGPVGDWRVVLRTEAGEVPVEHAVEASGGGAHFLRVALPEGFAADATLAVRAGRHALGEWPLRIGPPAVPARYAAIEATGEALIAALDAAPPTTDAERAWWHFTRGRALWSAGRLDEAVAAMRAAAEAAGAAGDPGEAARALRMAANVDARRGRLEAATGHLDAALALAERLDDRAGRSTVRYLRAEVDRQRGALREAERHAEAALADALAVGRRDLADYAAVLHAVIRQTQGHHAAARTTLEPLAARAGDMPPDLAGVVSANLGWVLLEGMGRGAFPLDEADRARAALSRALELYRDAPIPAANQHANLAALALLVGDLGAVERHVAAHDALDPGRRQEAGLFVDLIEARAHFSAGRFAEAVAGFTAVERRALAELGDVTGDYVWRARLGRARAHRGAGASDEALDAFRAALAARGRGAARTGVQDSRAAFFADHRALYDEAVAVALDAGRVAEAFEIADAARARLVVDLEARARLDRLAPAERAEWSRRLDAYLARRHAFEASRGEGEMLTEAERAGWRARRTAERAALQRAFDDAFDWLDRVAPIAVRGATAEAIAGALAADEALWLVHPVEGGGGLRFRVRQSGVERLDALAPAPGVAHRYVVDPSTPPAALSATWLPHGTLSLLTHAGQLLDPPPVADGPPLVIGDPDGTLPHARREAQAVAEALPGARLLLGPAADRAAVRAALADAGLIHFAGHGVLRAASPWDAHLRLAAGQRLTLEDLLLARPSAGLVLLSGCETGASAAVGDEAIRLGLAQGFLAAGSRAVIAADREVPDAPTARFVARFYAAGGTTRPADALRAAALELEAAGETTWDAWHLWGRR